MTTHDGLGDKPQLPDRDMHVDGIHIYINNYAPKIPNDLDGLTMRGNWWWAGSIYNDPIDSM